MKNILTNLIILCGLSFGILNADVSYKYDSIKKIIEMKEEETNVILKMRIFKEFKEDNINWVSLDVQIITPGGDPCGEVFVILLDKEGFGIQGEDGISFGKIVKDYKGSLVKRIRITKDQFEKINSFNPLICAQ